MELLGEMCGDDGETTIPIAVRNLAFMEEIKALNGKNGTASKKPQRKQVSRRKSEAPRANRRNHHGPWCHHSWAVVVTGAAALPFFSRCFFLDSLVCGTCYGMSLLGHCGSLLESSWIHNGTKSFFYSHVLGLLG